MNVSDANSVQAEVERLRSLMWNKTFFVMHRKLLDATKIPPNALEHLQWIIGLEKEGRVLASGPAFQKDDAPRAGLTVFRVASWDEAESLARSDPFYRCGAVDFEVVRWQVTGGRMSMTFDFSDQTWSVD